uniref:GDSL esterase/lipase n=2 Tax=Aegilops tauschii subsp. strangulata TaxID=200361 RepID=A0A453A3H3_AEGTS|nr:GDSL esterase/lipase At1g33811-like [Aegilops tauschii subsp. strangulata]
MAARVSGLAVGFLCLLAMLSPSAQQSPPPDSPDLKSSIDTDTPPLPDIRPPPSSPRGYELDVPPRNVTCKDTDGKRPGCTGTCPRRCPQCIVLCPDCKTLCHDEVQMPRPVPPPAMLVFGDGQFDNGNNGYLEPPNYPYSGTGRLSNGANLADAIAYTIGFPQSPLPFMSLRGRISMWGANYASMGAGIRNSTNGERSIPLSQQLEDFRTTRALMGIMLGGEAKLRAYLSKSIFLLGIGSQDLDPRWNIHLANSTEIQSLVALYGEAVTSLYDMGARKLAIVNVGLIGCAPQIFDYRYGCDQSLNDRAAAFNAALKPLMAGLASKKKGLFYSIGDFHSFTTTVFADPSAYWMMNIQDSCSFKDHPERTCSPQEEYWFWDSEFMTDQACRLTATAFYYGPPQFTAPMTFKALLEK